MKGFLDRLLLPGYVFKKREGSPWWDRYLTRKTAHIICTMDQPPWFYRIRYGVPSHHAVKNLTLQYCGIKKSKNYIHRANKKFQVWISKKWIDKIESIGKRKL